VTDLAYPMMTGNNKPIKQKRVYVIENPCTIAIISSRDFLQQEKQSVDR